METLLQEIIQAPKKIIRFEEIASFRYGKMPTDVKLKGRYPIFSGYRIVGYSNDEFNSDEDLIIVARGVGGTGDVKISPKESFVTNLSIIADLDKTQVEKKYLFYKFHINTLRYLDSGSAQSQITIQDLNALTFKLPQLSVQKKIVEILSAFDEKIENNDKIIQNLEATAQAIFDEWFVNFRFPGYEKMKFIESESGEIPEGWEEKSVLDVIERIGVGKKYDNKSALTIGKIQILDQGKSGNIGYHNEVPGVVASIENPVVVFTNHTCYYRLMTEPFSCIQNVLPYVGKNGYPTLFIYFLTKEKIKMQEYKGHWPDFEQQNFVVPPVELAHTFAEKTSPFIAKMVACEKENIALRKSRDRLLAKLV